MSNLETRVAKMEQAVAYVDLSGMTDAKLVAHAGTFPMNSRGMCAAVLTLVGRRPSEFPVVKEDPDHARL